MSSLRTLADPAAGEAQDPEHGDGAAAPRFPSPAATPGGGPAIGAIRVAAYAIPTDRPESDGTLEWRRTVLVAATVEAGGQRGFGYTYASPAAALLASGTLGPAIRGLDALDTARCWRAMVGAVRNVGRPGIAATAISALDVALWDLKGRLLSVSLVDLLGRARDTIPAYGSGGFTSYEDARLARQLGAWAEQGFRFVKMKVGRQPSADAQRVDVARAAIGDDVELFVDANGAFDRNRALAYAEVFADRGVTWFEEPVSSDDLEGLRLLRDRAPAGMDITAGEYGYDLYYFRRMLEAGAVDVMQPDVTRCTGVTGFMYAGAVCRAYGIPVSAHTAPSIHTHLCCALPNARHIEYFHDHVRIEEMLFEGAQAPRDGALWPDLTRPGLGLELKESEAARFAI